jgi:hypothetical protein
MRRHIVLAGAGAILLLAGAVVGTHLMKARSAAEGSAVSALSRQVLDKLALHYSQHGRYPPRLADLGLDLAAADGANASTLTFLRYASEGSSFTYAETGPDEWHRRVWWCAGPQTCGFLDMR